VVQLTEEVEAEIKLRPTVSQPVRLGVRHPSGTRDEFFFPLLVKPFSSLPAAVDGQSPKTQ
jgi:hypothetical protein